MQTTRLNNGDFAVQFTPREFQVLVGVLGLANMERITSNANEEGYTIFAGLKDTLVASNVGHNPIVNGITNEELSPGLTALYALIAEVNELNVAGTQVAANG